MSAQVAAEAVSDIPKPPPAPVQEHQGDDFDPNRSRGLFRVWNIVLIFGPITDAEIRVKIPLSQGSWQEYMRYHPEVKVADAEDLRAVSQDWYIEHEIDIGLKNGYLVRNPDQTLSAGPCPPEHRPPTEQQMRYDYIRDDNLLALEILRNKTDPARMQPDPDKLAGLKESIRTRGLKYRIKRWRAGADLIIVDGLSRERMLGELGLLPNDDYYEDYPEDTLALEVLWDRITLELNGTTKDQTTRARNAYIARLAKAGLTQEAIAKRVDLSQAHVSKILSASRIDAYRGQVPPQEVIAEWVRLSDGGWSVRDIAEDYVWGKSTVQKYIDQHRNGGSSPTPVTTTSTSTPAKNPLKEGTRNAKFVWYLSQTPSGATAGEFEARMGVDRGQTNFSPLVTEGLLVILGKEGKAKVLGITDKGRAEIKSHRYNYARHLDRTPAPTPMPAPVPPAVTSSPTSTIIFSTSTSEPAETETIAPTPAIEACPCCRRPF